MKRIFTFLISLMPFFFLSAPLFAQSNGDYQTIANGDWSNVAIWQIFSGGVWIAASTPPDNTAGVITIQTGDSVTMTGATTFDQTVVANGAILAIFNNSTPTNFTINNSGTGDDLIVNNGGRLYLAFADATLTGAGTLRIDAGGQMILEFSGNLNVGTTNNGELDINQTASLNNMTLTNNHFINWISGNILMTTANVINNDSVAIQTPFALSTVSGSGTFSNSSTGTLMNLGQTDTVAFLSGVTFSSKGIVAGTGWYVSQTPGTDSTTFETGNNSADTLILDGSFESSGTPTYFLGLYTPSGSAPVAGVNNSLVEFNAAGPVDLSSSSLTVQDFVVGDNQGTTYTIMTTNTSFLGNPTLNLSWTLGNYNNSGTAITVQRTTVLPINWGPFTAIASNGTVKLNWSTFQESNSGNFTIQRSTNGGENYDDLGSLPAQGYSSVTTNYAFVDENPNRSGSNDYRIVETDRDGKQNISSVRIVSFTNDGSVIPLLATPNPVHEMLQLTVQTDNISVIMNDMSGRTVRQLRLAPGYYQNNVSDLAAGVYQLNVYKGGQLIDTKKIVKL